MSKYKPGDEVWHAGKWRRVLYCTDPETLMLVTHCRLELSGPAYTMYELVTIDDEQEHKYAFENWIGSTSVPQD